MSVDDVLRRLHFSAYKSAVIAELIGTFLLVLTMPLAVDAAKEVAGIAIGFMLMSLVFAFGYISGGHFNPAVSLAVFFARRDEGSAAFPWHKMVLYVIAQFMGAGGAAFYTVLIHGREFPVPDTDNQFSRIARGFAAETVFTFVICSVVLHTQVSMQRANDFYGFAVGMALLSAVICMGGITRGIFNPAAAVGLTALRCVTGYCTPILHIYMHLGAEFLGCFASCILFNAVTKAVAQEAPAQDPAARTDGATNVAGDRVEYELEATNGVPPPATNGAAANGAPAAAEMMPSAAAVPEEGMPHEDVTPVKQPAPMPEYETADAVVSPALVPPTAAAAQPSEAPLSAQPTVAASPSRLPEALPVEQLTAGSPQPEAGPPATRPEDVDPLNVDDGDFEC